MYNWKAGSTISVENHTFEIIHELASGGMGSVYEAYQLGAQGFRKRMAIKRILSSFTRNSDFIEMFIGEAKLVANLIHQNIVQLYYLGKADNSYFMAMEFVDGITLHDFVQKHRVQKKPIPYEISAFIISRVARALNYAHTKTDSKGTVLNLVHRDCTPKNIMIDTRGYVKLTDFGVAKAVHYLRSREGEILVGKVAYMSPEQAAFEVTDGRSDIFSLGISLWEMLTGINCFVEADTDLCLEMVKKGKINKPSLYVQRLPKALEDLTVKALMRDKNKRYATAAHFCADLEKYLYHDRFGITNKTLEIYLKRFVL
ncbi:MAG: serine/threonine protein kinase [Planctomycetes bacterium]|nr:serine/threonine protein kinase [Planctomycetota bacterium]